ncbi:hypothetical protein PanWU01x14_346970 [Parasponia andersonii]|uniref:Uncharacterized protein n=1 Tax=Parasponia andersonii TaxID=3476 RepID=A0A2P5AC74_PARAD|nr:hypothetical protein PanWU01x14_346970 [Parasponia andersonii]
MEKDPTFQTALLSNGSGTSTGGSDESCETDFGEAVAGVFMGEGAGDGAMADANAINRIRMRVIELELELELELERAIAEKVKL